ncbi:WLM domain-containing protein [Aspergillus leporis]|uniref:WLM domain-containing protein n=1 Tax=Aspergillus leporis TaxID=41062 RepID=A0A5N5XBJ5_9EURO|nr:WLM domain-containing protein [Aspergillus leporis]
MSSCSADNPILSITIHHKSTAHTLSLPQTSTLEDLTNKIHSILQIPPSNQKLLIAPKPGMLKSPFPPIPLTALLPLTSPKFKITLLGTPTPAIEALHAQSTESQRRALSRASALSAAQKHKPRHTSSSAGGIHTLSSPNQYTFHRCLPLSYLPNPARSLQFLERLRDDPGIRAAMAKHKFSVPLLTEMNPAEHTTSESRTLGLNRNKGEVIELRLRTDAYDGYRDYRTIRKTLCHELAHCVFSEHDRDFWDLTGLIEREVERGDWKSGGHRLTGEDFYVPADWENERGRELVDECGWTGGEFVLGGLREDEVGRRAERTTGDDGVESRREVLARAAEERMKKERRWEEEEGGEN